SGETCPMKKPRFFAALALVGLMAVGTVPALATCGTGSQNPSYTVMVCLSPDNVTVGQTVTVTESATTRWRKLATNFTLPEIGQLTRDGENSQRISSSPRSVS